MSAQPKCATCRHWTDPKHDPEVRTTVGNCAIKAFRTTADVGCIDHAPAEAADKQAAA